MDIIDMDIIDDTNFKQILDKDMDIYVIMQRVYKQLGGGHTEFIYHRACEVEFRTLGILYDSEKRISITYDDFNGKRYSLGDERIDLFLVERNIIIELKAAVNMPRECEIEQIKKYYRELKKVGINCEYGFLVNFPQAGTKPSRENIDFLKINFL